ncbi:MAG: CTP-dependent riboflavin kinase [archaeon]|nr:CTP-dependent riboflavin kinase [archaeon]
MNMQLRGTVTAGLGRASVFMAQPHYQDQFKELFDQTAWPGTLNVQVESDVLVRYIALRKLSGIDTLDADASLREQSLQIDTTNFDAIRIRGFLRDGVSFGGATAFLGNISHNDISVDCAILIPDLTRHVDVIEIISPLFLRETLNVHDDDEVRIEIYSRA